MKTSALDCVYLALKELLEKDNIPSQNKIFDLAQAYGKYIAKENEIKELMQCLDLNKIEWIMQLNGGCLTNEHGTKMWYKEGQRHRDDGPAIEYANGAKEWFKNGFLHREDGPAIEYANGEKKWFKNGIPYEPTEHEQKLYKAGNL